MRRTGFVLLLLASICAAMFLPGLGRGLVTRQQELRVLLAARTMAEGGSWLIPQFMGEERLRKPPLMYWLVATAFKASGSTAQVGAARVVSTACATALVLATFLYGRRFVGRPAAFLGALVLATSLGFMRHARLAETDIPQATFCALAIFSLYFALTARSRRIVYWMLAGLFAGTGFMIKGPASIAMPLAAVASFLVVEALRSRRGGRNPAAAESRGSFDLWVGPVLAVLIFSAIAAPWYIAVAMKTAASTRSQAGDEIGRLLLESRHPGPFVYYVYTLPARMGIWALLLPVAVVGAARRCWHHRAPRFVLCWMGSAFLILSALKSKQEHYALLLFVPSALFCGWLLRQAFRRRRSFYARYARTLLSGLCVLLLIVGVAGVASHWVHLPATAVPLRDAATPLLISAGMIGLAGFLSRRNPLASIAAITVALLLVMAFQSLRLERLQNGYAVVPDLFEANRAALQQAPRVVVAGSRASMLAWYAHRDLHVVSNEIAAVWREADPDSVLIASERNGDTNIVAQIPAAPLARAEYLDVAITLFRKAGERP